jgi:hypothetical protein
LERATQLGALAHSRGAISRRTISRLCAMTRLVASRISPRGAGTVRADICCAARRQATLFRRSAAPSPIE